MTLSSQTQETGAGTKEGVSFSAHDYAHMYYPPIRNAKAFLPLARFVRKQYEQSPILDLRAVMQEMPGVEYIAAENIVILDFQRFVVRELLPSFEDGEAVILDIGGGPTIYQHIALSLIAKRIVHSEYSEENRNEVWQWINKEEKSFRWEGYFDLVRYMLQEDEVVVKEVLRQKQMYPLYARGTILSYLLTTEIQISVLQQYVRDLITDVAHGDVFKKDLDLPVEVPAKFDVVTCNFVIESATGDCAQWEIGMKNSIAHIQQGGYFVLTSIKDCDWYSVGDKKVPACNVDEHDIKEICERNGIRVIAQRVLNGCDKATFGYEGMVFTLGQFGKPEPKPDYKFKW